MSAIAIHCEGEGPEVLLVHGGAGPETTWSGLSALRARWTLCFAYRRGFPPSPPPPGGRQDWAVDAADLEPLLDRRPHLVGHSCLKLLYDGGGIDSLGQQGTSLRTGELIARNVVFGKGPRHGGNRGPGDTADSSRTSSPGSATSCEPRRCRRRGGSHVSFRGNRVIRGRAGVPAGVLARAGAH